MFTAVAVVNVTQVALSVKLQFSVIKDAAIAIVNIAAFVIDDAVAVANAVTVFNIYAVAVINDVALVVAKC